MSYTRRRVAAACAPSWSNQPYQSGCRANMVEHVALHEYLATARRHHERRVPDAVAGRADRGHAGRHLLVPGIARDVTAERVEHPPIVVEQLGHAAPWRPAHLAVVHPEPPLGPRHLDLRAAKPRIVG